METNNVLGDLHPEEKARAALLSTQAEANRNDVKWKETEQRRWALERAMQYVSMNSGAGRNVDELLRLSKQIHEWTFGNNTTSK